MPKCSLRVVGMVPQLLGDVPSFFAADTQCFANGYCLWQALF
eukprot:CAMPEP_0115730444 /NCGR_PEP_ID=MMETSP0272-20121206/84044_1 /TAXON_ID=71861 /ORGANISM="Scrippsiella trochoidea, Strain CCMP3099" /LENGTH=41 /DNA_ID= /DNA_START= /DNA_END= /DNA_ORIENTATION=